MEQNGLDTLVALRILIEALKLVGVTPQPGGPDYRPGEKQAASAGIGRRQVRQEKSGVRPGGRAG